MKLKIRPINESNDKKTLTEADVNRGYRIKAIEKISQKAGDAVEAAGYKYKPVSQTGFYILPDFGYLSKLQLIGTDDEEPTFSVKLNNVFAKDLEVKGKVLNKITYAELEELTDDIGEAMAKTLIAPASFEGVSENLSEEMLLEYGPWSAIKNIFSKASNAVKDFTATRAANKAEKQGTKDILEGINETLTDALNDAIKLLLKDGKQYVKVVSKIDGNTLLIELKCDFVTAITFHADPRDARKVVPAKLLTPLGEVRVKGKTIDQVLSILGKVLNINFGETATVDDEVDSDASAGDSATGSGSWEELIGADAFAELGAVGESVDETLTEAYKLKIPASNYQKALDKVANETAKEALIRYFLLKESNGALSEEAVKALDSKIVGDIADIISEAGTFNPNASFELMYILKYIAKNKAIHPVPVAFAKDLPRSCQTASILENPSSIIYNKILFNTSNDVSTLKTLVDYWYTNKAFKKALLGKLSTNIRKKLASKFEIPEEFATLADTETLAMKRYLLLDPSTSGDKKKFRNPSEIKGIATAVLTAYNDAAKGSKDSSHETDDETDADTRPATSGSDVDAILDTYASDVDAMNDADLKDLLKVATQKGLGNDELRTKIAKAILTALGKID